MIVLEVFFCMMWFDVVILYLLIVRVSIFKIDVVEFIKYDIYIIYLRLRIGCFRVLFVWYLINIGLVIVLISRFVMVRLSIK